jgi:hypothetical protein
MSKSLIVLSRIFLPLLGGFALVVAVFWLLATPMPTGAKLASLETFEPRSPNLAPAIIHIPQAKDPITLDGYCKQAEYYDAGAFQFSDASSSVSGTVYLKHDNQYLYVCMAGFLGSYDRRFASVYLDTDYGQEVYAGPEDYGLRVNITDTSNHSVAGTGSGNYNPTALTGWSGKSFTTTTEEDAEYQIPIAMTGGMCGTFGLAVYHHWISYVGNDYGWPSNRWYDAPNTWQPAQMYAACEFLPVISK